MSAVEDYNYFGDPRVVNAGKNETPMLYLEDGEQVVLPMKWAVCPTCSGKGKHVNPSIDAGGISADAMHDDPDFADAYMSGAFDQLCNQCAGRSTIPAVDWDRLTPEQTKLYEQQLRDEADDRACQMAELRMGA